MTYEKMQNLFPCVPRENSNGETEDHHDFAAYKDFQICARCGLKRLSGYDDITVDASEWSNTNPPDLITISYKIPLERAPAFIDLQHKFGGNAERYALAFLQKFLSFGENEKLCVINEQSKTYRVLEFE